MSNSAMENAVSYSKTYVGICHQYIDDVFLAAAESIVFYGNMTGLMVMIDALKSKTGAFGWQSVALKSNEVGD